MELFVTLNAIYPFCFFYIEACQVLRDQDKIEAQNKQILDHTEANVDGGIAELVCLTVTLIGLLPLTLRLWAVFRDRSLWHFVKNVW